MAMLDIQSIAVSVKAWIRSHMVEEPPEEILSLKCPTHFQDGVHFQLVMGIIPYLPSKLHWMHQKLLRKREKANHPIPLQMPM